MSTFPSNRLEESLRDAADGRLQVGEWLEALLTAQVWAPVTAAEGGSGTFPVLSVDGGSYVAFFTSEEELSWVRPEVAFVAAPFCGLVQHLPAHVGVAVNPGGSLGLPVPAAELAPLPAVRSARRCWAAVDDNEPGLVLGVDVEPDSEDVRSSVLAAVRRAAATSAYPASVDVVFANDRDALTQWMHENAPAFHPVPGAGSEGGP